MQPQTSWPPLCSRRDALNRSAALLRAAGIEQPRLEARLLLAHAAGITAEAALAKPETMMRTDAFQALLARRLAREPMALILGRREFWSLSFAVTRATLIPRPETESVLEAALGVAHDRSRLRSVLDLGTGTGCLLLAALSELPGAFGVGVDQSPDAALVAARNAADLGFGDRATFLCGDWAAGLEARFDLVLSNPPYIPTSLIEELMPDVAEYEPRGALDGGSDGLASYRRILADLSRILAPGGIASMEVSENQADAVRGIACSAGFTSQVRHDLGGIARALVIGLPGDGGRF